MDSAIVGALIGMGFLTVVNIVSVAYLFGRVRQQLDGVCKVVDDHENRIRELARIQAGVK